MIELILELISVLLAFIATYIGVTNENTWLKERKRPTLIGFIVIGLALLTVGAQIGVKTIQAQEKVKLAQELKSYKERVRESYTGWISVGLYDENTNKWDVFFLLGLETPEKIVSNNRYFVKNQLNVRIKPPDYCPDIDNIWFGDDAKTTITLPQMVLVEIVDVKSYPDCGKTGKVPGKVRVTAEVFLVPNP